jgi:AraC-like DNA-binding protein
MKRKSLQLVALFAFCAFGIGCTKTMEPIVGENVSSKIEYRFHGKTIPPQTCSHESLQILKSLEWFPNHGQSVRAKRDPSGLWLRLSLSNESLEKVTKSILIQWINIPFAELCSESNTAGVIDLHTGYRWENWLSFLSPIPHFNVDLGPGESRMFYLRVVSNEDLNYPIRVLSATSYQILVSARLVAFGIFVCLAILYSAWTIKAYKASFQKLYLSINFHYLSFFLLVYLIHGREFASLLGNQNNLFRHSYYLLLGLNHFVFFCYMASFNKYFNGEIRKSKLFWAFALSGFLYILVPLFQSFYDYRIFMILVIFGSLIVYMIRTHSFLLQSNGREERIYFIGWSVFQALVLLKTLYHFDFYPYHSFVIYASTFFLPVLTAGSLYSLQHFEKRKLNQVINKKSIYDFLDVPSYLIQINQIMTDDKVYLENNFTEEQMANRLGITYHQLSEIVNSEFKVNFPTLMNQYRIEDSKKLLIERADLNVADIGKMAGFGSRSAFYLEFKKHSGMNPNDYRKKYRKDMVLETGKEKEI